MPQQKQVPFPDVTNLLAEEAAEQWLAYNQSGLVSAKGKQAFSAWLSESPDNQQAYIAAEQLWQDLGIVLLQDAPHEPQASNDAKSKSTRLAAFGKEWLWGIAATLLIGFGALNFVFHVSPQVTTERYVSQVGEIRTLALADRSTVTLSADSTLEVQFSDNKRALNLLKGRAYFEVAPDKSRPFVVSAGNTSATAVGTAFDVNNTVNGVNVAVTHGIVDVRGFHDQAHTLHLDKKQLFAGQIIHTGTNGKLNEPQQGKSLDALSWRHGRLVFEGESLAVITEEVNRYRKRKIRLQDYELKHRRITLSVPANKTDLLISAIEASEPVTISETDSEVVISLVR